MHFIHRLMLGQPQVTDQQHNIQAEGEAGQG